jgi:hypothetical protein
MEVKTMMKKVLVTSAATITLAFVTTIAFSGGATAGQKAKIAPAVVVTIAKQQCQSPGDPGCPLMAEQIDILNTGHDLTADQQKVIDDAWTDDSKLSPEELAIKKKYNIK